jgi:2'-5' RNA ligase
MLAIASLLDPETDQQIRRLWELLEEKCGLLEIKSAPFPHFSWAASEDIEWRSASKKLEKITHKTEAFKVRTAGLGIFSGPTPVLYIPIVKSPFLLATHLEIWKRLERFLIKPQGYYSPNQWIPHITIALGDLDAEKLSCAVQDLAFQKMAFDISVTNISVIYHTNEGVGIKSRFELG